MALSWSSRRKILYSGVTIFFLLAVAVYIRIAFFSAVPTCFDGRLNGNEESVDCGGSCSLVCAAATRAPRVLWARAFENGNPGTYAAVAYIENTNQNAGARSVHYTFDLYDANNKLLLEKSGVTDFPPVHTLPIVEPSLSVGNRAVAHVQFSFSSNYPITWNTVPLTSIPSLRVASQQLSPDGTRLDATIENNSLFDAPRVSVIAVLFDTNDVAQATSKSILPLIKSRASEDVTFTWPDAHERIARVEISVLPSF